MKTVRLNKKLITSLGDVLFMHAADLIAASSIPTATWYYLMQHIEGITIQQLLSISNGLKIPVRRFFSEGKTDVVGKRDDYVAEDYIMCYYDAVVLQHVVDTRTDATWQKAAKATGMTYDNLKKSTLAVRRLPVDRFLTVCKAFGVDPFTVLIDPNPDARRKGSRPSALRAGEGDALRADIAGLRESIRSLRETVNDLHKRYEELLKAHDDLARRVNVNSVNIENITGNFIGIAAEP